MYKRAYVHVLLTLLVVGVVLPALAIQPGTDRALNAFRRYEPDFQRWQRDLAAMARRVAENKVALDSGDGRLLLDQAKEIMEAAQKRFELLEDLEKDTVQLYPEDRSVLFDGWTRIDDAYLACRRQFDETFGDGGPGPKAKGEPAKAQSKPEPVKVQPKSEPSKVKPESDRKASDKKAKATKPAGATIAKNGSEATAGAAPAATVVPPAINATDDGKTGATTEKRDRFFIGGNLKLEFRNKNERYTAENQTLPNNLSQGQLELRYQLNPKDKLVFQDKFIKRRRNEDVRENQAVLAYLHEHSKKTMFGVKDTYYNIWYPQNSTKDYRDNLFELNLNRKENKIDRLYSLGYKVRDYPNYSQSNFKQWNATSENTYYIRDGVLYTDLNYTDRVYDNSRTLDYKNTTWGVDYNRSFGGNKSEVGLTNTYDYRHYDTESPNLFRTNYWDDYLQFRYQIPASTKWTWAFEDEYQMRDYASDFGRGYARMQLKTTGTIKIDKQSHGRVQHTYIYADENTRNRAHGNHIFAGMYERKFTDKFRGKLEGTRHRRWSMAGNLLDFGQDEWVGKLTWNLRKGMELAWVNDYLNRGYDTNYYNSYRDFTSGVMLQYAKPKKLDWSVLGQARRINFDAANTASPYARTSGSSNLSKVEGRYNFWIGKDKRVKLLACAEKTYYKSFDNWSQELQLDFTRPLTVTEFTGEFEMQF